MEEQTKDGHLTTNDYVRDIVKHPAFKGFGELVLPWEDNTHYYDMPLNQVGSLMPYNSHVNPDIVVGALNHMIDEVGTGKTIFYDFHTGRQKQKDTAKNATGLFLYRGKPGAPFAIVCPGGGFSYVGAVSGESISDLYIAGFLPGILLALAMCVQVYYLCKRHGFGAPEPEDRFSWSEVAAKFKKAILALLMPLLIMGGIYSGIFTVTEAAVVAVFYAVAVCVTIYRNTGIKDLTMILRDSVVLTSMIYFIIMTSTLFGFLVTVEQLSNRLLEFIMAHDLKPWMFLAMMNVAIFIMGSFLAPATKILIVVPLVYPVLKQLGISGVHFGILMTINMELAFLMPPIGMHLFVMSIVCKEPLERVIKGVVPFFLLLLVGMFVITYIPWISLVFLKH